MRLNESLKRAIYNSIMSDVSKVILMKLNEDNENNEFIKMYQASPNKNSSHFYLPTKQLIEDISKLKLSAINKPKLYALFQVVGECLSELYLKYVKNENIHSENKSTISEIIQKFKNYNNLFFRNFRQDISFLQKQTDLKTSKQLDVLYKDIEENYDTVLEYIKSIEKQIN